MSVRTYVFVDCTILSGRVCIVNLHLNGMSFIYTNYIRLLTITTFDVVHTITRNKYMVSRVYITGY
jgi:hypothetical protein